MGKLKTKAEILKDKYVIERNGKNYTFDKQTPKATANKLIDLHINQTRVVLDYGDIKTNKSWNEEFDVTGTIGLTKGWYDLHYPILIHNKRSMGGGLILCHCIIGIKTSKGKNQIYTNKIN